MKNFILFFLLLTTAKSSFAQLSLQWQFDVNTPEESRWIVVDSQDNVYTLGKDGGLRKYNHFGDSVFYVIDTATGYKPYAIAIDSNDNIVTIGNYYENAGSQAILVEKYNTNGILLWATSINTPNGNEEFPTAMTFDQNNDIYITGWDGGQSSGRYYSAKINAAGVFQWGNSFDQGQIWNQYYGKDIAVLNPNIIYSTGTVNEDSTRNDMIIIRYNQNGDTVWTQRFNYYDYYSSQWPTEDQGIQVETDQYGSAYVLSTVVGEEMNVLIKYDSTGYRIWVKQIIATRSNIVNMIVYNNEIYLGGNLYQGSGMQVPYVCKMDTSGTAIFSNASSPSRITFTDMDLYDGGIVLTGHTFANCTNCNQNGHTLLFDSQGNQHWLFSMDTQFGMYTDEPYGVTTSRSGGIYVTGNGHGSSYWMNTYKLYPCDRINATVTHNGPLHTANYLPGANYFWRDCANDSIVAFGGDLYGYNETYPGDFEVEISVGTCSDSTICPPTGFHSVNDETTFSIYPNPAENELFVEGFKNGICSIYSIDGQLVKTIELPDRKAINISELNSGMYIFSVRGSEGTKNFKFTKSNTR